MFDKQALSMTGGRTIFAPRLSLLKLLKLQSCKAKVILCVRSIFSECADTKQILIVQVLLEKSSEIAGFEPRTQVMSELW